jgi:hypothetical protein
MNPKLVAEILFTQNLDATWINSQNNVHKCSFFDDIAVRSAGGDAIVGCIELNRATQFVMNLL